MATTLSTALASAITFKVRRNVLQNLRASLHFADARYAEQGEFDAGHDALVFVAVPDLAINVTPLSEAVTPTPKALSITTVSVSTDQYGDLVEISDLAKVKSPIQITEIASEHVSRQANESLDQIARDVIAAGGTTKFAKAGATQRSDLVANDVVTAAVLRKLRSQMRKAKVPTMSDGSYLLMVSPEVEYDIRNDSATGGFIDVNKYARPEEILRGEVGKLEGFRILTIVNAPTFASTTTVHASIAVGGIKGWGAGYLQSLRTYYVAPGGDHDDPLAQRELVGWKVSYGVAVLNNSYYFRLESGASTL